MNSLDLKILKAITTNNIIGLEFCYMFSHDVFDVNSQLFAKLVISYVKSFKAIPTRRTLKEWHGDSYFSVIDLFCSKLESFEYDLNEYNFDLQKLKDRYVDRTVREIKEVAEDGNSVKNISLKLQNIKAINEGRGHLQKTVKEHITDFREQYSAKQGEAISRIASGYSAIDIAVGGFAPADLFLIGGETGAGKSQFLCNIGLQMWMQQNTIGTPVDKFVKGYNVMYFSLEMPYDDCYARFMARLAQVPERSISDGTLEPDEIERVAEAEKFIEQYPYEFEIVDMPRDVTIDEIEMRYHDALLKYKPDVVIVDYMGLMKSPVVAKEQDWLKMGHLSGELHEFGRMYGLVMGSAVQLTDIQRNSQGSAKEKSHGVKVGLHRVGRSSAIMHHATLGLQIETRQNEETRNDLIYHIIKNRRGPHLKSATLQKNFTYCSLLNLEYMPYVKGEGAVPVESVGNQENVDEEHIPYASHNLNTCISATESKVLKRQAGLSQ